MPTREARERANAVHRFKYNEERLLLHQVALRSHLRTLEKMISSDIAEKNAMFAANNISSNDEEKLLRSLIEEHTHMIGKAKAAKEEASRTLQDYYRLHPTATLPTSVSVIRLS